MLLNGKVAAVVRPGMEPSFGAAPVHSASRNNEPGFYYPGGLDSSDLDGVKGWGAPRGIGMTDLSRLRGAAVTASANHPDEFMSRVRPYSKNVTVSRGRKIAFHGFPSFPAVQEKILRFNPRPADYNFIPDILNMRKVHDGPLGKFTGKGETICVIDSGISPNHPDFFHPDGTSKLKWFVDFHSGKEGVQYANDPIGHGSHMCGDAAGTGKASGGLFAGTAPDADLVVLRVETDLEALKAAEWILANGKRFSIDVVSLSIGVPATGSYRTDPLAVAIGKIIDQGIYVTAAAGNDAAPESINSPGIHPFVVTTTALDTHGGKDFREFNISPVASGGPSPFDSEVTKPNLALPGVDVYGPLAPNSLLDPKEPAVTPFGQYYLLSGTSAPCQMAAGMIACIHQALKENHLSLTPQKMLDVLQRTARKLIEPETGKPVDPNRQGAGVPDGFAALSEALRVARQETKEPTAV